MYGDDRAALIDAVRELDKYLETLDWADRYFTAESQRNAATHMAERVVTAPLASAVQMASSSVRRALQRFKDHLGEDSSEPF